MSLTNPELIKPLFTLSRQLVSMTSFALLCTVPGTVLSAEYNQQIDELFTDIAADAPGCNVGVVRGGEFIHKAGYGLANLELDVPLDSDNVHRMGSVSKQFTALAVLILVEDELIDLNASLHRYIPGLRDYGADVTVNQVLGHIAGMADYDFISSGNDDEDVAGGLNIKSAAGGAFRLGNEDYLTIEEFFDVVKQAGLRHPPGEKWEYSNLGYFLLSMLVEEVSGQSLRDFSEQRIFAPLGMNNSFFSDDATEIVKNRAYGYSRNEAGAYVTDMTNLFWVGDGGLHTNLDDMLLWDRYLRNPTIGNSPPELLELFNTPNSSLPARDALYANGQFITETDLGISYFHSGGWLGTTTWYGRLPEQDFSVMIMCNDVSLRPADYYDEIIEIFFGNG
ncbi:MAG: serine hydrolase [Gammaproteobacteria bacterium]|nr:serine hydrolase [Gammaproteobacteria bacterium]MDD9896111.1 serine hydrolase [Gammaproteobacteria bacterium]MDD9959349.1 serine hydrolase [Gammaproteobacteria bacterium]